MAKFLIRSTVLTGFDPETGSYRCMGLEMGKGPVSVDLEAKNVAELVPLVDKIAEDAKAEGKPLMITTGIARGQRKPPGFDAAARYRMGAPLTHFVNVEQAPRI